MSESKASEPQGAKPQGAKGVKPKRPARGDGRDALIDATVRIAIRDGIAAVTLRAVAAEAGVTNGLIVHHFGTRTALVREALLRGSSEIDYESYFASTSSDPAMFAYQLCEVVEQVPKQHIFVYQALLEAIRVGDLLDEHREGYDEVTAMIAQSLEQAGVKRSSAFAWLIVAALDGLTLQQLLFADRAAADERLAELHQVIRDLAESD